MFKNFKNQNLPCIYILISWVVVIIVKKTQNKRDCLTPGVFY